MEHNQNLNNQPAPQPSEPKKSLPKVWLGILLLVMLSAAFSLFRDRSVGVPTIETKAQSGSVLIFIDEEVYQALPSELNRLGNDIEKDLGVEVLMHHGIYKNPMEIRDIIENTINERKVLGSILIGDIPTFHRDDGFYTDWFYQDLSNYCTLDANGNFVASLMCNTLDAESRRELFTGRITPPLNGQDRIALIKKYLDKNHEYRNGNISFQKRLLVYPAAIINEVKNKSLVAPQNSLASNLDFSLSMLPRYERSSVDFITDTNYENARREYLNKLKSNSYEAALINIHGSAQGQFVSGGYGEAEVSYQDIKEVAPNIFYINLLSCSNGAFEEENYLAGWLLFSGNTMVVNALTRPGYIGGFLGDPPLEPVFFLPLNTFGSEITIGDVIRRDDSLFITQTFGDPTLHMPSTDENGAILSISDQEIDFGVSDKVEVRTVTIRNEGTNVLTLRRLPSAGMTINSKPLTDFTPQNALRPFKGANFLGFDLPSINPLVEVSVLPDEEISFEIVFAPAELEQSKQFKKGKYFDVETFLTNDPTKPYLEINLSADVL